MEDLQIYEEIIRIKNGEQPAALVTLIEATGSTPRKPGAKMLVHADGQICGTIGGGRLELELIHLAQQAASGGAPRTCTFNLTEDFGHACGGTLSFYVEPLTPRPHLVIFGAGHIGRVLADTAQQAGFYVSVVEEDSSRPPVEGADQTIFCRFEDAFSRLNCDGRTALAVVTSEHDRDFSIVEAALKTPAGYIGMLGSRRKRAALMETLQQSSFPPDQCQRIITPIGLDIGAETPAEIAISIVGQLITFRRSHATKNFGHRPGRGTLDQDGAVQAASAAR